MMKLGPGKTTLPGEKQVFRRTDGEGRFLEDVIGLKEETIDGAEPLLETVMENGKCLRPHPPLETLRERFRERFSLLGEQHKPLQDPTPYPVKISDRLLALQQKEEERISKSR